MSLRIAILIKTPRVLLGSGQSMFTLGEILSQNHNVTVFGHGFDQVSGVNQFENVDFVNAEMLGEPVIRAPSQLFHALRFTEATMRCRQRINEFNPDIILSQHTMALVGALSAQDLEIPHVLFLRDLTYTYGQRHSKDTPHWRRGINRILEYPTKEMFKYILDNSASVVANSHFTKNQYEEYWDIDVSVVYPFIDIDSFRVDSPGNKILHVSPHKSKGIETTIEVAKLLPEETFVVAGSADSPEIVERMKSQQNIEHIGYVENMLDVYEETGIVIMPSESQEPFGRVPIEAGASGIPTISSDRGGLVESVGYYDLIVKNNTAKKYVAKVAEVKNNISAYSSIARQNATLKSAENQVKILSGEIERSTGISTGFEQS